MRSMISYNGRSQRVHLLTLYPGIFTPVFVACSTNVGEGLVKLITCNDILGHWVDVLRSCTFLLYSCKAAL